MVCITKELESKKPELDEIIKKYVPEEFDEKHLDYLLGKPRYNYHKTAVTKAIAEPTWEFLKRGGKRWRPALFLMLTEALGGDPEKVKDFVLVPELVHNGTLFIDDIEDGSETRRGQPASHLIYGVDISLNCGNSLYFIPLKVFMDSRGKFPDETLLKAYEIYSQEMINISFGQAMDIYWHKHPDNAKGVTESHYLQMCAYKTGTLARMSAKLAALLSGAREDTIEKVGRFAETIGVAFQIQDDILNLTATSNKGQFTKEYIGSDITEGKRTLMEIHTLNNASPEDKKRLEEILAKHTKDKQEIQEAINIMKKYGSIEYARQKAKQLMQESWKEVDKILPPSEAKEKLAAFAEYLIKRDV